MDKVTLPSLVDTVESLVCLIAVRILQFTGGRALSSIILGG